MTTASNLGFPRIGAHRELKKALESYWAKKSDAASLEGVGRELRARHWSLQRSQGIAMPPSNDFTFYDHVLDTIALVGAVPPRYVPLSRSGADALTTYFAMARGHQGGGIDVSAMEMTKWFDTNYHYIVPELSPETRFALSTRKPIEQFLEAKALGVVTRPVLLGPVSFLLLGKMDGGGSPLALLERLVPVYEEVLRELAKAGAEWVQLDEPTLVLDLDDASRAAFTSAYARLRKATTSKLLVATYFGPLRENLKVATSLPIDALHVDLVRAPEEADAVVAALPKDVLLSAGVVDGRNIWRTDLDAAYATLRRIADARGADRVLVAPSCSLLHAPVGLATETKLDAELRSWLAFATEKLAEVSALATALATGKTDSDAFVASRAARASHATSPRAHDAGVKTRLERMTLEMRNRASAFPQRREAQRVLGLPLFPTTTIGSFPQTAEVRAARAEFKARKRDQASYDAFLREATERAVRAQEKLGLDVLVHGEFERNDMVEYFGEQLAGFAFTENGWVQSYGSRCVKPPFIFGDVARPTPMTVAWSTYAQSLTTRPMKGMLTGPVTILQWSFVRTDQPREVTCRQIALALRDEVTDLEAAGLRVIQIDEPALREGLPLRRSDWAAYLDWAVDAFRVSSSSVRDATQIHTHMCYAEFNDIIGAVAAMDADVVSIETSRSRMELLGAFGTFKYPNEIGPGVYDIHSPRVPTEDEMVALLEKAAAVIDPKQLWVNPDCGLKTRGWPEVLSALGAMVAAATRLRARNANDAPTNGSKSPR